MTILHVQMNQIANYFWYTQVRAKNKQNRYLLKSTRMSPSAYKSTSFNMSLMVIKIILAKIEQRFD